MNYWSFNYDVLVLHKSFVQVLVHQMGLVWIRAPFSTELKAMFFNVIPFSLFHHELSSDFVLSLFPVNSRIQDHDNYVIHSDVASDESKPILSHTSELIFVLDETIEKASQELQEKYNVDDGSTQSTTQVKARNVGRAVGQGRNGRL